MGQRNFCDNCKEEIKKGEPIKYVGAWFSTSPYPSSMQYRAGTSHALMICKNCIAPFEGLQAELDKLEPASAADQLIDLITEIAQEAVQE